MHVFRKSVVKKICKDRTLKLRNLRILLNMVETANLSKKWNYLRKILERSGPFQQEAFVPSADILDFLNNTCKILVIGKNYKHKMYTKVTK